MPAADDIARGVLDALRPDQVQMARDQKRMEERLTGMLVAQQEAFGS